MKKGFIQIMFANIITLIVGVVTNFLLPKYLSFDSYAIVKTYALYLTYVGFFSLGYHDGMYLKYGGKELQEIDEKNFGKNFSNYFVLIFFMTLMVFIFGLLIQDNVVIAFAFGIFSNNVFAYLKSFYQATGEFKLYSKSLNLERIIIFIINILLIFIFKSDNPYYYIWIQVLSGIIICIYLTIKLNKKIHFYYYFKISFNEIKDNIKSGFILMLGNFSNGVLTSIDRWFVNIYLTSVDFAKYSFATSMENIIFVFITPITIAMYNYFCKKPKLEKIKLFKNASLMWGALVIALAYPAKFILEHYLTNYKSVNNIIFILFATQIFNIIVKGIYVNIYKSQKRQKKYLIQMVLMLILAAILDYIFMIIFNNMTMLAIGTLLTTIVWMLICELEKNNEIRFNIKEYLYIIILLFVYLLTGYAINPIIGFIIYIVTFIILSVLLMNNTTKYLFNIVKNFFSNKIKLVKTSK